MIGLYENMFKCRLPSIGGIGGIEQYELDNYDPNKIIPKILSNSSDNPDDMTIELIAIYLPQNSINTLSDKIKNRGVK